MVTYSRVPLRLAISNLSDDVWSICSGINTVHETGGDGSSQPSSPCQRKPVRHTLCNFHHSAKHDPRLSPPAKLGKKPIRTIHLAFGLCGYHWEVVVTKKGLYDFQRMIKTCFFSFYTEGVFTVTTGPYILHGLSTSGVHRCLKFSLNTIQEWKWGFFKFFYFLSIFLHC
jgi:hypothetical protein